MFSVNSKAANKVILEENISQHFYILSLAILTWVPKLRTDVIYFIYYLINKFINFKINTVLFLTKATDGNCTGPNRERPLVFRLNEK